jgi:uncharacterized protein YdeI (YjbR/CyaY-like superfamily)
MPDLDTLMETHKGFEAINASTREEWRQWLHSNHEREGSVWLIIYKNGSGVESVQYADARDEAICYGWIDSKPNSRDDLSYYLFFSPRNPKTNWSKVNKERVDILTKEGRMAEPGLRTVQHAKRTGTWSALKDVDNLIVPTDM